MLFPFNLELIRILNIVVAVLVRVMVVECVFAVVFMMTMECVSKMVIFVPSLFFWSVTFTPTLVMCTLRIGVPFTMTIIEMITSFYIDNFVIGLLRVVIDSSLLVLNGSVFIPFLVILVLFRTPLSLEFFV